MIEIPKGVAMMIRSILNIDPLKIETQINEFMGKAQSGLIGAQKMLSDFDTRLSALEAATIALTENIQRLTKLIDEDHHAKSSATPTTPLLLTRNGAGNGIDHSPGR